MATEKAQGTAIPEKEIQQNPLCVELRRSYFDRVKRALSRTPPPPSQRLQKMREYYRSFEEAEQPATPKQKTQTTQKRPKREIPQTKSSPKKKAGKSQKGASGSGRIQTEPKQSQNVKMSEGGEAVAESVRKGGSIISKPATVAGTWIKQKFSAVKAKVEETIPYRDEEEGECAKFPWKALVVAGVLLGVVLLYLGLFAKNYYINQDISKLEQSCESLKTERYALNLELEKRENIINLREKAEELEMVDGGYVGNIFISVSDGERVEIVSEDTQETSQGFLSELLETVKNKFSWFEAYFR